MALENVIYPQESLGHGCNMDLYGAPLDNYDLGILGEDQKATDLSLCASWESSSSPEGCTGDRHQSFVEGLSPPRSSSGWRKGRRTRTQKSNEELENQRMTHIAVERNRRKQMNDYLAVIRSLMPPSYVLRGDQASIIAGAINFVKELEQRLQTLEGQKRISNQEEENDLSPPIFSDFFAFPQYVSTRSTGLQAAANVTVCEAVQATALAAENRSALADIKVTVADSHANVKILSKTRPRQLLNLIAGLQCLRLTILHINVTAVDQRVLYSLCIKLEDGGYLSTVDEIANAVHQVLGRIQEEAAS